MENEKKKRGRPPKFKTALDLEIAIDLYFMDCEKRGVPYTVEGLACSLDVDRNTLLNYSKDADDPDRSFAVKQAKRRILQDVVERSMSSKNPAGAIFNLKNNFGYVDKVENESTVRVEHVGGMNIVT